MAPSASGWIVGSTRAPGWSWLLTDQASAMEKGPRVEEGLPGARVLIGHSRGAALSAPVAQSSVVLRGLFSAKQPREMESRR